MSSMKQRRSAMLAMWLMCALAGCSSAPSASASHHLRVSIGLGDPNSLNIHLDPSGTTGYIAEMTAAWLARYDRNGRPVPELGVAIPTKANGGISADGKTIVWHLRRGVRWSDGAPFTSKDVAFSVRTVLNPANNEEQGTAGWDHIASVSTPDAYTAVFHLKKPYADFLPVYFGTAANEPCLLPEHILGKLHDINTAPYNSKPVGIGPFRVVEWRRGDAIELEANPYYWRGMPKLHRITWKLIASQDTLLEQMQTGEVDLWPEMSPRYTNRMQGIAGVHVLVQPNYRTTNLDFQMTRPIVGDVRVRTALRYAIDRRKLIATVLHGYGFLRDGIVVPQDPPQRGESVVEFDPTRARAILDADGWKLGDGGIRYKDGKPLTVDLVAQIGNAELDQTIELLRANLHDVGVQLTSRRFAPNVFRAPEAEGGIIYGTKYDAAIYPRTLEAISDLIGQYSCSTIPPNGENATRYCSKETDALFDRLESTYDEGARRVLLGQLRARIIADEPTIILYVWKGGFSWRDGVTGFDPPVLTPFDDMMNVDVRPDSGR
jgi:peptide/nickel transport system substrate-binding protein